MASEDEAKNEDIPGWGGGAHKPRVMLDTNVFIADIGWPRWQRGPFGPLNNKAGQALISKQLKN